jgi:HEAT repeat protein
MVTPTATAKRIAPAASVASLLASALLLAGCELPNAQRAAKTESILPVVLSGVPTPEEAIRMASDVSNPDRRARGLVHLMNAPFGGEPVYVALYERRLAAADPETGIAEEHPAVRSTAARALSLHGDPKHAQMILDAGLLEHEDVLVRLDAVQALQRLHNPAAVRPLLNRIHLPTSLSAEDDLAEVEPEPDVRAEAADALGQYAERRVFEGLVAALDDDSLAVSSRAHKSLRILTGQDLPADRGLWGEWRDATRDLFAGQTAYVYPIFKRDFRWTDIIPFTFPARNEIPASPIGAPQLPPA